MMKNNPRKSRKITCLGMSSTDIIEPPQLDLLIGKSIPTNEENRKNVYQFIISLKSHCAGSTAAEQSTSSSSTSKDGRLSKKRPPSRPHAVPGNKSVIGDSDPELDFEPDSDSEGSHRSASPLEGEINQFSEKPASPCDHIAATYLLEAIQNGSKRRKRTVGLIESSASVTTADRRVASQPSGSGSGSSAGRTSGADSNGKRKRLDTVSPNKRSRPSVITGGLCIKKLPKSRVVRELAKSAFRLKLERPDFETKAIDELEKSVLMRKFMDNSVINAPFSTQNTGRLKPSIPREMKTKLAMQKEKVF